MTWIAHETWFVAVIVTLAVRVIATRFPGVDIPFGPDARLRPATSAFRPLHHGALR